MKSYKAILIASVVGCLALVGCAKDTSGDTQVMPASSHAAAPNNSPTRPSGIPKQAQDAISKAAPPSSGPPPNSTN